MKKRRIFVLFALVSPVVCGCSIKLPFDLPFFDKKEEIKEKGTLSIEGSLNKVSYNFNDSSFDFSGLKIMLADSKGNKRQLNSNEYTLSCNPKKPRGYTGKGISLTIKSNLAKQGKTKVLNEITVSKEDWRSTETSEKNAYYSGTDWNSKSGDALLGALQKHSFQKHTNWITYSDVGSYYSVTDEHRSIDEIPSQDNVYKNEYFYSGSEVNFGLGNKEHVWACANSSNKWPHGVVDNSSYKGGGSDLYHVRPSDPTVNKARGNCLFTELNSTYTITDNNGYLTKLSWNSGTPIFENNAYAYANYAEPADEFKGDLARIIAYVYMHYSSHSGGYSSSYIGLLELSRVLKCPSGKYGGSVAKMLVAWDAIDPVSEVERYRNHTVQQIQGNRNPFVDFPNTLMSQAFNNI